MDNSTGTHVAIASKIPVPAGSSFVISDTGKTLLESDDVLKFIVTPQMQLMQISAFLQELTDGRS